MRNAKLAKKAHRINKYGIFVFDDFRHKYNKKANALVQKIVCLMMTFILVKAEEEVK